MYVHIFITSPPSSSSMKEVLDHLMRGKKTSCSTLLRKVRLNIFFLDIRIPEFYLLLVPITNMSKGQFPLYRLFIFLKHQYSYKYKNHFFFNVNRYMIKSI